MYPLLTQLPNRSNDYGIEIRGNKVGSSKLTIEKKGKTKVLSVVILEKIVKLFGQSNGYASWEENNREKIREESCVPQ